MDARGLGRPTHNPSMLGRIQKEGGETDGDVLVVNEVRQCRLCVTCRVARGVLVPTHRITPHQSHIELEFLQM